jgi:phosphoglucomutase
VRRVWPALPYLEQLRRLLDLEAISKAGIRLVVDPRYGAGSGYLDGLLSGVAGVGVDAIHQRRDPAVRRGGCPTRPKRTCRN